MVDILCIPYEQWGAALLYFTGNDIVSDCPMKVLTKV
jgi:DNA polymerase/3'-5' exonuclease PolX